MDTALFSGLLVHLADNLALDHDYIDRHTAGFDEALVRAREHAPAAWCDGAARPGWSRADVARFFEMFRADAAAW